MRGSWRLAMMTEQKFRNTNCEYVNSDRQEKLSEHRKIHHPDYTVYHNIIIYDPYINNVLKLP